MSKKSSHTQRVHRPDAISHTGVGSSLTQSSESRSDLRRILSAALPVVLIAVVALAAYANAWPNTLVYDDKFYAGSERFTELSNIPRYFKEHAWESSGVRGKLYRPLLLTSVTFDARLYGDWVAGYHLTNIFLHAMVSLLVYGFLLQLLRMSNGEARLDSYAALLTALVFAVHPVYTEVVNSIFNRSEMLVALGAMAGLYWFLRHLNTTPGRAWFGLALAYTAVLFCKESSIVLPGIAVILVLFFGLGDWKFRVRNSFPVLWLLIPLAFYFYMRAQALAPVDMTAPEAEAGVSGISNVGLMLKNRFAVPGLGRLMRLAGFWYDSIKIMLWPFPLTITYRGISRFSEIAGLVVNFSLVSVGLYQVRHKQYGLLAGLAFFYIASLPAGRFMGDIVLPHLAERYLYFPSVGLAIVLTFGLRYLARRYDSLLAAAVVVLAIIIFTPTTWARNAAWSTEISLFESEYGNGYHAKNILSGLTAAYLKESEFQRVSKICDRHVDAQREDGRLSSHCATAYSRLGRLDEAERAYLFATTKRPTRVIAHANLGRFYLSQNRWQDAKKQFELAVDAETIPANRAYRQGHMLVRLYPRDRKKLLEAKAYFAQALKLQPAHGPALQWLDRVNRALGEP